MRSQSQDHSNEAEDSIVSRSSAQITIPERPFHVFISHVKENAEIVSTLRNDLEKWGIRVWQSTDGIPPGSRWKKIIKTAIRNGKYFIACFSSPSLPPS